MSTVIDDGNAVDSNTEQATKLADQLLPAGSSESASDPPQPVDIFTADVEFDVARFNAQYEFYVSHGLPFPCLSSPTIYPIPIDISLGGGFPGLYPQLDYYYYRMYGPGFPYDLAHELRNRFFEESNVEVSMREPEETRGFLKSRIIQFLATRFNAPKQENTKSVALPFRVVTSSTGLRVHYSPAYFFNPSLVFGSPTSPVDDYIRPGRYIFGVAGSSLSKAKFSDAEFDIPDKTRADLMEL